MMMMPSNKSARMSSDDFGSSRLLQDIEEISKALCLHHAPQKGLSSLPDHTQQKSKYVNEDSSQKENNKKSSIWKWKPLKALTHIRNHRLSCCFFLHVHSIEGLPQNFNDLSLCVYWKRKYDVFKSHSIRVCEGVADLQETLMHRCSVYVSKSDPHDDVAKYKPKLSLLYASVVGVPGLDLGKHWIDLTRLLPLTLMELEEEKNHYGKWMTSFKLSGKAKGATMNVSFGYSLSGDSFVGSTNLAKIPYILKGNVLQRVRSIPSNSGRRTHVSSSSLDIQAHRRVGSSEGPSMAFLYQLLDDAKSSYSKELNLIPTESDCGALKSASSHETLVYDDDFMVMDKGIEFPTTDQLKIEKDSVKSVESSSVEIIDVAEIFDIDEEIECKDNDEACDDLEVGTVVDDIKESGVCTEESTIEELESFLHCLSICESPEMGFSFYNHQLLGHDHHVKSLSICEGGKLARSHSLDNLTDTIVSDFMNLVGSDSEPESPRELLLRQFEEEALASGHFGFDFNAKDDSSFLLQGTLMERDDGVGSSLISRRKAKIIENLETKALMQEWGLNDKAFQNSPRSNSGAFGSPVYLSPELPPLGEGLNSFLKIKNGGILRSMSPSLFKRAKNGERLIVQVSSSVVLPPAMGSNCMDVLLKWATAGAEKMLLQATRVMPMEEITGTTLQEAAWETESEMEVPERLDCGGDVGSEYVSLENLAPLAVEKIQHLLIEGLRIQSGMSNEEPPSSISLKGVKEVLSADSFGNFDDINELIRMSVSLEEWTRLDSAAHRAHIDKLRKSSGEGSFSKNFMFALRTFLRDPLRDYETVGIPMLALIQVERSYMESDPAFKITEVHVTGFRADPGKKPQSGPRWLQSSGMVARHPMSRSNALVRSLRSNKAKHEDTLWSISSYVRNPDIVFK